MSLVTHNRKSRAATPAQAKAITPRRWWEVELTPKKIKPQQLVHVSRQLATFRRAGVPLITAIDVLLEDADRTLAGVLTEVRNDLMRGIALSDAVERHPAQFPLYYRRMLRSAEVTGRLDDVLDQLADYIERDVEAKRKVANALLYPAIVVVMALGTILILVLVVLPQFETLFASFDVELPAPTRALLAVSGFVKAYGLAMLAILALTGVGWTLFKRTSRGRIANDNLKMHIPVVGRVIRLSMVERFCRVLASTTSAGVPITTALSVAGETLNTVYSRAIGTVGERIAQGRGLATPLAETKLFPTSLIQMVRVGEDTGDLPRQLQTASGFYARELDQRMKTMATLLEPLVVIVVGALVGFVAVALVSAMYGLFSSGAV